MYQFSPDHGMSTIAIHAEEGPHAQWAHVSPIYQTSLFGFPDVDSGAEIVGRKQPGYYYTRLGNPNLEQIARKIAVLEAGDLLRAQPGAQLDEVAAGRAFSSGMAAITTTILARFTKGSTLVVQDRIYGNTYNFLQDIAPKLGIEVVWVRDVSEEGWQEAFREHPQATLAYTESPVNPSMSVIDLAMVAEIAHQHGAWLMVDNTFATPYCQRPLSLGADVVIHSTTKYLSGHGAVIGGAIVTRHPDFANQTLHQHALILGGVPSPFDCWLVNMGLKTFELRMQRHCENALGIARYLQAHPKVEQVYYPGLDSHPGYSIVKRQMHEYGGMLSFELEGGLEAGMRLLNNVKVMSLAVSLGNVDTLIQHPASMTHAGVPRKERLKMGISDGLVRLSVGLEDIEDLITDLDHALAGI
jgi:methionine-gamma-lyase